MEALSFVRRSVSTPLNCAVTLAVLIWLALTIPDFVRWAFIDAVWNGPSPKACANVDAACWLFIRDRFGQILYGIYPAAERWRVVASLSLGAAGMAFLSLPRRRYKLPAALSFTVLYPIVAGVLLRGGVLGLASVPTSQWGGLMLTCVIAAWTIATSLPTGLALALARRSTLPIVAG